MAMIKRTLPTAYRRRGATLMHTIVHQTAEDKHNLERIRELMAERYGFNVSSAVAMAMALEVFREDTEQGVHRIDPAKHVNIPARKDH